MDNDGASKAPKDKQCRYCGQSFTSSSLGRHLDLYIKSKNPKAPDGLHNVDEIRKLRGSITRRQPRGGVRRNSSGARNSQTGSKRSCETSDGDSIMSRSPDNSSVGFDTIRSRSNSNRVFDRQMMKSSLDVKQRVQDAIDTAKAAELALREMMGSWRAAKLHNDARSTPFAFNPLSMDFPALCLQCLEPPPTLHSSTPHPTSTSWSLAPPGERQNEALRIYFQEEFRKWKPSSSAVASPGMEVMPFPFSQVAVQQEDSGELVQNTDDCTENLESQVIEHLEASFQVWDLLSMQRQQELWVLEMARSIDKRQKEVVALEEAHLPLKQEIADLKSQLDHLRIRQSSKGTQAAVSRALQVDEKMAEFWHEAGNSIHTGSNVTSKDRRELNTMVSGAIEKWRNVIVTSRAASSINVQRPLDEDTAPLKTPTSTMHPPSPQYSRSGPQQHFQRAGQSQFRPGSSTNGQITARNDANSSAGRTATPSDPRTSVASTPAHSIDEDSDEDADADADVEMEEGAQYLTSAAPATHHPMSQMVQHSIAQHGLPGPQHHQMHSVSRHQDPHVSSVRHSPYPPRGSPYGAHSVLPSQQMHMNHQVLQSLEHHLAQHQQSHGGMGWNSY